MQIKYYKTKWAQEDLVYGQPPDLVILESKTNECHSKFEMHQWEFDNLFGSLFSLCFEDKKIPYLQIVKEWNEMLGFCDMDGVASVIGDIEETIQSIQLVDPDIQESPWGLTADDLKALIQFLETKKTNEITIQNA